MGGHFSGWFLRNDQIIGPIKDFFDVGLEEAADVGNLLENKISIAAVDFFEADVGIEDAQIAAFADELFEQRNDGAFAQIVSIFFEGETEDTETFGGKIEHVVNGAREVAFVAG